ncbi:MAG: ABC transporter ATP-binding protein [Halobacteriaceae archaeon]
MTAPVVAEDVAKSYGDVDALDGVSLAADAGEVLALVGPNGAGKTTLVRCLTGTLAPDAGEVTLLGESPREADRERVGLLPQSFAPAGRLTARELVAYYAGLYETARDPGAVLREVGIAEAAADTWYENLSGGQKRRACVAATVVNDPDVLFLDEPTTGIDPEGRRAVWAVLETLVGAGTTLVLTTHDMTEAARLADRVAVLADGRLVAVDAPDALVAAHGGDSELRVTTAGSVDASVLDRPATVRDGALVVPCGPDEVAAVVRDLDRAGVSFEAIEWHEPTLEDVYVELAGGTEAGGTARRDTSAGREGSR